MVCDDGGWNQWNVVACVYNNRRVWNTPVALYTDEETLMNCGCRSVKVSFGGSDCRSVSVSVVWCGCRLVCVSFVAGVVCCECRLLWVSVSVSLGMGVVRCRSRCLSFGLGVGVGATLLG